jgi:DNA-binding transcriptional LysR family regulator
MVSRNLDLALLRTFVAVAETGSMTTAAQVVKRSQGAISQQIKRLEAELRCALFRRGLRLRLTRAGEKLLAKSYQLLSLNDEAFSSLQRADFAGEVRLGVAHDVVRSLMPAALREFKQGHPGLLVTLTTDTSQALLSKLALGELDMTLTTDRVHGGDARPLFKSPLVWAGAHDGEAHRRPPLSVALGDERCAFRASAVEALARSGIEWRPIRQSGGLEAVFTTLEADCAIAPLLECAIPASLERLRERRLPALPDFSVNIRVAQGVHNATVEALADAVSRDLTRRFDSAPRDRSAKRTTRKH